MRRHGTAIREARTAGAGVRGRLLLCAWMLASSATAATVRIQIRAFNPHRSDPQTVELRQLLPRGVNPEVDLLSTDGLEVGYDVKEDLYFVHGEVTVAPTNARVFNIEIQDIWTIPPETLDRIEALSSSRMTQLRGTDFADTAQRVKALIDEDLEKLRKSQADNAIERGVKPIQHIRAYELSKSTLARLREDLSHLENFVISSGQDPEVIEGQSTRAPTHRDEWAPDKEDFDTLLIRFSVENTSTNSRVIEINRPLPPELTPDDVMEVTEPLQVGYDEENRVAFVFDHGLEFEGGETKDFEIRVRDKWTIPQQRYDDLTTRTTNLIVMVQEVGDFPSLGNRLESILGSINEVAVREAPGEIDPLYVAFHRRQGADLNDIEQKLISIEQLLQKRVEQTPDILKEAADVFKTKAPDKKTTWIIIYIILGFLALVSLIFFLRWSGRSKDEHMQESAG